MNNPRFSLQMMKLENYCRSKDIKYLHNEYNMCFYKEGVRLAISYTYLYRQSGIACIYKEKGENFIEIVEVTDSMFYDNYVKPVIDLYFIKK